MHAASATFPAVSLGAQTPDASSGRAPRYRLRGALQWREFEGEWVVRAEPSGSLFQLDPLSAAVLGLLEAGPLDRAALLVSLATAVGDEDADAGQPAALHAGAAAATAWGQALDNTLARLVADDLVAPPARP